MHFILHFCTKKGETQKKTTDFRIWKFHDFLFILEGYLVARWLLILLANSTYLPS